MKLNITLLALGLAALLTFSACGGQTPASTPSAPDTSAAVDQILPEAEAKKIALTHAGVSETDSTFTSIRMDGSSDDNQTYELHFEDDHYQYTYKVDAVSGKILTSSSDLLAGEESSTDTSSKESSSQAQQESKAASQSSESKQPAEKNTEITAEQAKTIALEHAKLSPSQVTFIKVERDRDDGRIIYEVEFYSDNTEYDYDIDALTGAVLSYDLDVENFTIPQASGSTSTTDIGIAKAKEIALAKVPGANNNHIRIKQDTEDGQLVYEGEIIYNSTEYEFEIDAASGTIREWSEESIYD